MNSSPLKWGDIISSVQRAHLEDTKNIKLRQRIINQKYVDDADEQMKKRKQEHARRRMMEIEQRIRTEEQWKREEELEMQSRELKKKKEKQYQKDNFEMMQASKVGEKKQLHCLQHPFTSLVDESDRRREKFREKLRRQNEINSLQQKIRQKQKREKKIEEMYERQKYINHIEAFYLKKIEDRNTFKSKYLKLSNPEKSRFLIPSNTHQNIEKHYGTLNEQLMKTNKLKDPYVDNVLSSINKHIEMPDSSPAFLGRIPISSDRKKQLDYLERSAYQKSVEKKRLKTEGDIFREREYDTRRYTANAQELPTLESYYKNISKEKQSENKYVAGNQINTNSFIRNTTNELGSKKIMENVNYQRNHNGQNRSQNSTTAANKVFSTYDIIQNRRKYVCI